MLTPDQVPVSTRGKASRRGWIAACAAVLSGVFFYFSFNHSRVSADTDRPSASTSNNGVPIEGDWAAVKHDDFEIVCREQGELCPVKVTTLNFMRSGKLSFLVPEGTSVNKGDKVMALETKDLEDEMKQLHEDLAAAEQALTEQEANRDLQIQQLASDLLATKDAAVLAQLTEKETLGHPLPTEKEDA